MGLMKKSVAMVNFMCQFEWVKGLSEPCKILVLPVSIRVFLEEIRIDSVKKRKSSSSI